MVFGMCATRVIAFFVGIIKDFILWKKSAEAVEEGSSEGEKSDPKIVEITDEKEE
jgi:hypothetical protein